LKLEADLVQHAKAHQRSQDKADGYGDIIHAGREPMTGGRYGTVAVQRCHYLFCPSGSLNLVVVWSARKKPTYRALRWIRGLPEILRLSLLFLA
jgi:hypothetical protein